MRRPLRLWFAVFLAGCGGGNEKACELPTVNQVPQDCATVSRASWRIGPYPTTSQTELQLAVGESRALWLDPFVESECAGSVVSVTWSVDDPSSATVVPKDPAYRGSWVTGLGPGANAVRARIVFSDGTAQTVPRAMQVVASAPPAGTVVIAEGTVTLDSQAPSASADYRRFIPFTLPRSASQTDVRVDWASPLNDVTISFYQGECSGPASAACVAGLRYITGTSNNDVKPLSLSIANLPADTYTIRIDNLGPGPETIRYEVRIPGA
jgi:hypothetical protein